MTFKQFLRSVLTDASIKNLCNGVFYLKKPESYKADAWIQYYIISETENDYCGDKALSTTYKIQVSVFSKGDTELVMDAVRKSLEKSGFRFIDAYENYETDTQLYHNAVRYKIKKMKGEI